MSGTTMGRMGSMGSARFALLVAAGALLASATGCDTNAYCFANCEDGSTGTAGAGGEGGSGGSTGTFGTGGSTGTFTTGSGGTGGMGPCEPTNGGEEICDGLDNDCNNQVDDVDFNDPKHCGTCDNNCYKQNVDPSTVTCTWGGQDGQPGLCEGECASDYFDLDGDGACEYYCVAVAMNDVICDSGDDDCDGVADEDADLCSANDCGQCGNICVVLNGTAGCEKNPPNDPSCTPLNTACVVAACDPGWVDLDGQYGTGCEYQCTPTNGGVEVCGDGLDNDCDGLLDAADDLSGDPAIGVTCSGDPDGICALPANAGVTACVNGQVTCTGANVKVEDQVPETCNGLDDDCDGVTDDAPTDVGGSCGVSNQAPCALGTWQCVMGALDCVGDILPGTETCNGVDDDCDGTPDLANGQPPMDAMGVCGQFPAPPPGATSPCMTGMKACVSGTVQCLGDVGPSSTVDGCNVDANCDGTLTNQPNLMTDVGNCGSCGNDCYAGAVNSLWACVNGSCVAQGCQPGYYDLDGNGTCEYQCTFISSQEACNGVDDDCDGQVDESPTPPSKVSTCGISPAASRPECTTGVTLTCNAGAWQCSFPMGVCSPTCATATEICDGLDNDCDGLLNENVPDFGAACASDAGLPYPGHGACRTTGTKVCNGPNATTCSAMKANCSGLPGGCTETCDGVDNDCDGSVDEPFTAKGTDTANFVRPRVTQVAASLWVYSFEASRPDATSQNPGSGNGYWTSAPPGETLDQTPSCSVQNRIPWQNVTPLEAEQTCQAAGGQLCQLADWQSTCRVNGGGETNNCTWGYNPNGAACTSGASYPPGTKYCNLAAFDFNTSTAGDQDGLLPAGWVSPSAPPPPLLQNCFADWSGLNGNVTTPSATQTLNKVYDITGNLREIVRTTTPGVYKLMGGAFNTQAESGAACTFTFYTVDDEFKYFDTGFRCCFTSNPLQ